MRGRKPTLKLHADAEQPALPTCPEGLSPEAAAEFHRIAEQLYQLGTVAELDRFALALFASAWQQWTQAQAEIAKTAAVVKGGAGGPIANPWLGVATDAFKKMQVLIPELGLSPTARARLKPKKTDAKPSSKWSGLLAQ